MMYDAWCYNVTDEWTVVIHVLLWMRAIGSKWPQLRCLAAWPPGRLAAWLPGCLAAWLPGFLASWLPGCLAASARLAACLPACLRLPCCHPGRHMTSAMQARIALGQQEAQHVLARHTLATYTSYRARVGAYQRTQTGLMYYTII